MFYLKAQLYPFLECEWALTEAWDSAACPFCIGEYIWILFYEWLGFFCGTGTAKRLFLQVPLMTVSKFSWTACRSSSRAVEFILHLTFQVKAQFSPSWSRASFRLAGLCEEHLKEVFYFTNQCTISFLKYFENVKFWQAIETTNQIK